MIGDDQPSLAGAPVAPGSDPRGRVAGVAVLALDPEPLGGRKAYEDMVAETLRAVHRAEGRWRCNDLVSQRLGRDWQGRKRSLCPRQLAMSCKR